MSDGVEDDSLPPPTPSSLVLLDQEEDEREMNKFVHNNTSKPIPPTMILLH